MSAVLGKESAPIMHTGAGHAVVDHEEEQSVVQPTGLFELGDNAPDVLIHAIDDG